MQHSERGSGNNVYLHQLHQLTFGMCKVGRDRPIWPLIIVHDIACFARVQKLQSFGQGIVTDGLQITMQGPFKTCRAQASR